MKIKIDPNYKIDKRRLQYKPPASAVAELVQRPLASITGLALSDAYMRDFRASRSALAKEGTGQ